MAVMDHDGTFDSGKTYSHKAIARILGKRDRWVIEKVIHEGVKFHELGQLYMVSGHALQLWVEGKSEQWEDPEGEDE